MSNLMNFNQFKSIWRYKPIIILDTNTLLDLYRYSVGASQDIIKVLTKVSTNIWIPWQVIVEFERNKDTVKREQYNKYKNIPKEINSIIKSVKDSASSKFVRYKKYQFPNIEELEKTFSEKLNELNRQAEEFLNRVDGEEIKNKDMLKNNTIEKFIEEIKSEGHVGKAYNIVELISIYQEGETRYKYSIPPGYMDAKDKSDLKKFGDLIVWKQILDYAKTSNKDIIFATSDVKEDWWHIQNDEGESKIVAPRKELIEEFKVFAPTKIKIDFHMLTFKELISHLSKVLNIESIKTMLELRANEFIEGLLNSRLETKFKDKLTEYIQCMDMYEISRIAKKDIDGVNVNSVDKLFVTDTYLVFDEDMVTYGVEFKADAECNAEVISGRKGVNVGGIRLKLKGNFYVDRCIDYDKKDVDELDREVKNFRLDYISVVDGELISYEDMCIICGKQIGEYNYNNEGYICGNCNIRGYGRYGVCSSCGNVVPWEQMSGDGICNRCSAEG